MLAAALIPANWFRPQIRAVVESGAVLVLPDLVRAVVIAADADGPGRRAAEGAASRWRAEGRRVRIATPDRPGQDFNDLVQARGAHA